MTDESAVPARLRESVPARPQSSTNAPLTLTKVPRYGMLGLVAKYNWQYRRPFPHHCNMELDAWRKVATKSLGAGQVAIFSGHQYRIGLGEFRETFIWQQENVDWTALRAAPSSMLVPTMAGSAASSGMSDSFHYVRQVLAISFPALCWALRDYHTAEEIETAWVHMPLLKAGKSNRGQKRK